MGKFSTIKDGDKVCITWICEKHRTGLIVGKIYEASNVGKTHFSLSGENYVLHGIEKKHCHFDYVILPF